MQKALTQSLGALILAIGFASVAFGVQAATSASEEAVASRSLAFTRAAVNGDLSAFLSFMSDDYVMLWAEPASEGKKAGWATKTKNEWVEELRSHKYKYRSVELLNTKVYFHGDVAILTGDYAQITTRDGVDISDAGLFTETWVKRNGQWIIVSSMYP